MHIHRLCFKNLNLLKINDIHKLDLNICIESNQKIVLVTGVNQSAFNSLDKIHNYSARRRLKDNYFLKLINSKFDKTNIEILGPKYWANVPSDLTYKILFASICKTLQKVSYLTLVNANNCILIHCFSQLLHQYNFTD